MKLRVHTQVGDTRGVKKSTCMCIQKRANFSGPVHTKWIAPYVITTDQGVICCREEFLWTEEPVLCKGESPSNKLHTATNNKLQVPLKNIIIIFLHDNHVQWVQNWSTLLTTETQ